MVPFLWCCLMCSSALGRLMTGGYMERLMVGIPDGFGIGTLFRARCPLWRAAESTRFFLWCYELRAIVLGSVMSYIPCLYLLAEVLLERESFPWVLL
jgi:hypothetical protein